VAGCLLGGDIGGIRDDLVTVMLNITAISSQLYIALYRFEKIRSGIGTPATLAPFLVSFATCFL
jgi:hypothetical protein